MASSTTQTRPETEEVAPGTRYYKLLKKVEETYGSDFVDELDQAVEDRLIEAERLVGERARAHGQSEVDARLAAVEAQAERIAGKLEQLNEKLRAAQERKAAQEAAQAGTA